jgi:hypothetical protein
MASGIEEVQVQAQVQASLFGTTAGDVTTVDLEFP